MTFTDALIKKVVSGPAPKELMPSPPPKYGEGVTPTHRAMDLLHVVLNSGTSISPIAHTDPE